MSGSRRGCCCGKGKLAGCCTPGREGYLLVEAVEGMPGKFRLVGDYTLHLSTEYDEATGPSLLRANTQFEVDIDLTDLIGVASLVTGEPIADGPNAGYFCADFWAYDPATSGAVGVITLTTDATVNPSASNPCGVSNDSFFQDDGVVESARVQFGSSGSASAKIFATVLWPGQERTYDGVARKLGDYRINFGADYRRGTGVVLAYAYFEPWCNISVWLDEPSASNPCEWYSWAAFSNAQALCLSGTASEVLSFTGTGGAGTSGGNPAAHYSVDADLTIVASPEICEVVAYADGCEDNGTPTDPPDEDVCCDPPTDSNWGFFTTTTHRQGMAWDIMRFDTMGRLREWWEGHVSLELAAPRFFSDCRGSQSAHVQVGTNSQGMARKHTYDALGNETITNTYALMSAYMGESDAHGSGSRIELTIRDTASSNSLVVARLVLNDDGTMTRTGTVGGLIGLSETKAANAALPNNGTPFFINFAQQLRSIGGLVNNHSVEISHSAFALGYGQCPDPELGVGLSAVTAPDGLPRDPAAREAVKASKRKCRGCSDPGADDA